MGKEPIAVLGKLLIAKSMTVMALNRFNEIVAALGKNNISMFASSRYLRFQWRFGRTIPSKETAS